MLDYFNTREQDTQRSALIRKPYITYGISFQAPKQFQKPFTMFSKETFVNPYLSYEKNRQTIMPEKKVRYVNPTWTKKIDINQIQTERTFLKKQNELGLLDPQNRYYKELSASKTRFMLTKGQFTNFLQRNHSKKLFGPLQGKQRNQSRSLLTKNQIARKSHYKISQNFDKLTRYNSRKCKNKEPFSQKHLLQKTRFAFRQGFRRELQGRKVKKIEQYVLPHLNRSFSIMKQATNYQTNSEVDQENPQLTLLSNKSIQKLHDLRDFTYTQKYFTLDAKTKHNKNYQLEPYRS